MQSLEHHVTCNVSETYLHIKWYIPIFLCRNYCIQNSSEHLIHAHILLQTCALPFIILEWVVRMCEPQFFRQFMYNIAVILGWVVGTCIVPVPMMHAFHCICTCACVICLSRTDSMWAVLCTLKPHWMHYCINIYTDMHIYIFIPKYWLRTGHVDLDQRCQHIYIYPCCFHEVHGGQGQAACS